MVALLPSLDGISKKQWTVLKEKIKKANGRVVVLVHPFFRQQEDPKLPKPYVSSVKNVLKNSNIPIIILEGYSKVWFRKLFSRNTLVVPTHPESVEIVKNWAVTQPRYDIPENYSFIDKLKELGATHIAIGGNRAMSLHPGGLLSALTDRSKPDAQWKKIDEVRRAHVPDLPEYASKRTELPIRQGCAGKMAEYFLSSGLKVKWIPTAMFPDQESFYQELQERAMKKRSTITRKTTRRK